MSWCAENLSPERRREIAEELIAGSGQGRVTFRQNSRSELICLCPLHEESNPSFAYNWQKDIYNCSSGCDSGDLIQLYCLIQGIDQKKGFKAFLKQYPPERLQAGKSKGRRQIGKVSPPVAVPDQKAEPNPIPESLWEVLPPLPEEWAARLAETRGWSRELMAQLDLRLASFGETKRVAIPIRDEQGRLLNIRKYSPGPANNKVLNEKGFGAVQLWPVVGGGMSGRPTIWLCEGEPDCICALSHGLEAITATGGAGSWRPEFNKHLKGRDVVIAYDADLAGYGGAHKVAGELAKVAGRVRILIWPDEMLAPAPPENPEPVEDEGKGQAQKRAQAVASATREDISSEYVPRLPAKHGQDLTDYLVKHKHSLDDLEALLERAEEIGLKEEEPEIGGLPLPETDDPDLVELYEKGHAMARFKAMLFFDNKEVYRPPLVVHEFLQNHRVIHEPKTGKFYVWQGKYWLDTAEAGIKGILADMMGLAASKNRLADLLELLKTKTALPLKEDMDLEPGLLNVNNGMLDLDSGQLLPHDPACRKTYIFPYDWNPHDPPDCPRFKRAILEIIGDPEVVAEVLEFFGYCLWPGQHFKKALFLVGPKDCGKSLLQDLLRQLLGPDNCQAISMKEVEEKFDRAMLHRKLANICGEASADFFSSDVFKRLTGGDPIYASYKGIDGFTFNSSAKLFFSANERPLVRDKSDAFYERMLMVECPRQFKLGQPHTDPYLKDALLEELPGIFHLAVARLYHLRKRGGFAQSRRSWQALNAYRLDTNHVAQFVEEWCEFETHDGLAVEGPKAVVYKAYKSWADEMGIKKVKDAARFWQAIRQAYQGKVELLSKGPRDKAKARPPWVKGLFVREDLGPDRSFF
jgi:putative DNA primase/helicase